MILTHGEDQVGFLFFDDQGDENFSFRILEITKAKGLTLDILDEIVDCLQFSFRTRLLRIVTNLLSVAEKAFKVTFSEIKEWNFSKSVLGINYMFDKK
ncbi:hypothetical protein BMI76_08085 [Streptococcus sp. 'caviae']|nr:hypothetical protein BMI76_08085 [Streptococcus sp. 'caviae']